MKYWTILGLGLVSCLPAEEKDDRFSQREAEAEESQDAESSSGSYGPDNEWYHADVSDVPEEGSCGFSVGDRACNFSFIDQNGDYVELYQFAGKVVVLDIFANWCGPCQQAAASGEGNDFNEQYGDDAIFIGVMADGSDGIPTVPELQNWELQFGITYPIVSDINGEAAGFVTEGFPTYTVLDRDMTVLYGDLFPFRPSAVAEHF